MHNYPRCSSCERYRAIILRSIIQPSGPHQKLPQDQNLNLTHPQDQNLNLTLPQDQNLSRPLGQPPDRPPGPSPAQFLLLLIIMVFLPQMITPLLLLPLEYQNNPHPPYHLSPHPPLPFLQHPLFQPCLLLLLVSITAITHLAVKSSLACASFPTAVYAHAPVLWLPIAPTAATSALVTLLALHGCSLIHLIAAVKDSLTQWESVTC